MAIAENINFHSISAGAPAIVEQLVSDESVSNATVERSVIPPSGQRIYLMTDTSHVMREQNDGNSAALIDFMVSMIAAILSMQSRLSNSRANQTQNEISMSDTQLGIQRRTHDDQLGQINQAEAAQNQSGQLNQWMQILGYVIAAVAFVLTAVFIGPAAAVISLCIFALMESGVFDKALNGLCDALNINDPTVRLVVKFIAIVLISAVSGSVSGAIDTLAARGVETTILQVVKTAVAQGVMTTLNLSTGCISELCEVIANAAYPNDPEKRKTLEIALSAVLTVLLAVAMTVFSAQAIPRLAQNGIMIAERLSSLAQNSAIFAKLQTLFNILKNPRAIAAVMIVPQLAVAGLGIGSGCIDLRREAYTRAQGPLEALMAVLNAIIDQLNQAMQSANQVHQNMIQSIAETNEQCALACTRPEAYAAQLLI